MDAKTRKVLYEHWKMHVINWRQSGQAVMQWCTENNLSYKKFLYWRKKVERCLAPPPRQPENISFTELSD
jgi:hypothetical protein